MNLDPSTLTGIHTILSLAALASGLVAVIGLFGSRASRLWAAVFLATAIATSATGFLFPSVSFGASHWVGVLSLVALAIAVIARYGFRLAGAWRWLYAVGVVSALYFLVLVAITQAFQKAPALHSLAPTSSEPPYMIAQLGALVVFAAIAILAARSRPRTVFGARA